MHRYLFWKEQDAQLRRAKRQATLWLVLFAALFTASTLLAMRPMLRFVSQPAGLRSLADSHALLARAVFVALAAAQIVLAVVPGKPFEVAAGYLFGTFWGTILCLAGVLLGSAPVFLFTRRYGRALLHTFDLAERLDKNPLLSNPKRLHALAFALFAIPGTPKDVMTYVVGLTPMKLPTWLFITCTARLPVLLLSVMGGDALYAGKLTQALLLFSAMLAASLFGLLLYRRLQR